MISALKRSFTSEAATGLGSESRVVKKARTRPGILYLP